MTEDEWLTCTDPQAMLAFVLERGASERKLRLFAVTLAREVADPPFDPVLTTALDAAELMADGRLPQMELEQVHDLMNATARRLAADLGRPKDWPKDILAAWLLVTSAFPPRPEMRWVWEPTSIRYKVISGPTRPRQPQLLRELFGNPFQDPFLSAEWRTQAVVSLAHGIYQERAWDRMGVLGDALEESGAHPEMVRHCREPGVHVKGCHVLDAALDWS